MQWNWSNILHSFLSQFAFVAKSYKCFDFKVHICYVCLQRGNLFCSARVRAENAFAHVLRPSLDKLVCVLLQLQQSFQLGVLFVKLPRLDNCVCHLPTQTCIVSGPKNFVFARWCWFLCCFGFTSSCCLRLVWETIIDWINCFSVDFPSGWECHIPACNHSHKNHAGLFVNNCNFLFRVWLGCWVFCHESWWSQISDLCWGNCCLSPWCCGDFLILFLWRLCCDCLLQLQRSKGSHPSSCSSASNCVGSFKMSVSRLTCFMVLSITLKKVQLMINVAMNHAIIWHWGMRVIEPDQLCVSKGHCNNVAFDHSVGSSVDGQCLTSLFSWFLHLSAIELSWIWSVLSTQVLSTMCFVACLLTIATCRDTLLSADLTNICHSTWFWPDAVFIDNQSFFCVVCLVVVLPEGQMWAWNFLFGLHFVLQSCMQPIAVFVSPLMCNQSFRFFSSKCALFVFFGTVMWLPSSTSKQQKHFFVNRNIASTFDLQLSSGVDVKFMSNSCTWMHPLAFCMLGFNSMEFNQFQFDLEQLNHWAGAFINLCFCCAQSIPTNDMPFWFWFCFPQGATVMFSKHCWLPLSHDHIARCSLSWDRHTNIFFAQTLHLQLTGTPRDDRIRPTVPLLELILGQMRPTIFVLFWHRIRLAQKGQGLTFWNTLRWGVHARLHSQADFPLFKVGNHVLQDRFKIGSIRTFLWWKSPPSSGNCPLHLMSNPLHCVWKPQFCMGLHSVFGALWDSAALRVRASMFRKNCRLLLQKKPKQACFFFESSIHWMQKARELCASNNTGEIPFPAAPSITSLWLDETEDVLSNSAQRAQKTGLRGRPDQSRPVKATLRCAGCDCTIDDGSQFLITPRVTIAVALVLRHRSWFTATGNVTLCWSWLLRLHLPMASGVGQQTWMLNGWQKFEMCFLRRPTATDCCATPSWLTLDIDNRCCLIICAARISKRTLLTPLQHWCTKQDIFPWLKGKMEMTFETGKEATRIKRLSGVRKTANFVTALWQTWWSVSHHKQSAGIGT